MRIGRVNEVKVSDEEVIEQTTTEKKAVLLRNTGRFQVIEDLLTVYQLRQCVFCSIHLV